MQQTVGTSNSRRRSVEMPRYTSLGLYSFMQIVQMFNSEEVGTGLMYQHQPQGQPGNHPQQRFPHHSPPLLLLLQRPDLLLQRPDPGLNAGPLLTL